METRRSLGNPWYVIVVCVVLDLFLAIEANAGTVYKWVDRSGVTHYDQEPPEDSNIVAELLFIPDAAEYPARSSSYASIIELAERLERSRLERERLRLAKEQALTLASLGGQSNVRNDDETVRYRFIAQPGYPHPHHRFHSKYYSKHHKPHVHRYKRKGVRAVRPITKYQGARLHFSR